MRFIKEFSIFESTPEMSSDIQSFLDGQKISPDFIPHENFHMYKWLAPKLGKNKWYYQQKSNGILTASTHRKFGETLDPLIKESVLEFNRRGIPTTPSCSGHFNDEEYYRVIYDGLEEELGEIRSSGILLVDPETGKEIFFKDPDYILPWTKESFTEKAREHGKIGVLGFHDPEMKYYNMLENGRIPHSQIMRDGDISIFITSPNNQDELLECWNNFTSVLFSI